MPLNQWIAVVHNDRRHILQDRGNGRYTLWQGGPLMIGETGELSPDVRHVVMTLGDLRAAESLESRLARSVRYSEALYLVTKGLTPTVTNIEE